MLFPIANSPHQAPHIIHVRPRRATDNGNFPLNQRSPLNLHGIHIRRRLRARSPTRSTPLGDLWPSGRLSRVERALLRGHARLCAQHFSGNVHRLPISFWVRGSYATGLGRRDNL